MEEMKPKDTYTYTPLARRIRQAAQSVGDYFNDEVNLLIPFFPSPTHLATTNSWPKSPENVPVPYPCISLQQIRPSTICASPLFLAAALLWSLVEPLPSFGGYRQYPRYPLAHMVDGRAYTFSPCLSRMRKTIPRPNSESEPG